MERYLGRGLARFSATLTVLLANLSRTGRGHKQTLSVGIDSVAAVTALWLAYSLRHGELFIDFRTTWYLFLLVPMVTVLVFAGLGIYRWVVRSANYRLLRQLAKGCLLASATVLIILFLIPPERANPRSIFVLFGGLLFLGVTGVRVAWQGLFGTGNQGEPIAIYGAGSGGRQLARLLAAGVECRPVVFIDDDPSLHGITVGGLMVLDGANPELGTVLRRFDVSRLVLAMPSLPSADYRRILDRLESLSLPVQTMPDIAELVTGRARLDQIRDIAIGDILGRVEVPPDLDLIGRRVIGKTVLVTGGGGSIGAELCRQIAGLAPELLIVLDSSEANLYHVTEEMAKEEVAFLPRLGSVNDRVDLERLMARYSVDTVYHAAACKHVSIVEAQPIQGVETNVFGTLALMEAATACGVSDFVLISTDKAVRPANAMGASKRVAELLLQAEADAGAMMRISVVRFGNVLGSSGSVVPKFRRQIEAGEPITLTDRDVTRYFMTIPEAAQLVLQASAIAQGGDVFVLDMGEPIRILDLVKAMVRLYGRSLQEDTGDEKDIVIVTGGLRPGEKMYEELFITDTHRSTVVNKVFTAREARLPWWQLRSRLAGLREAMDRGDESAVRERLMTLVIEGNKMSPPLLQGSQVAALKEHGRQPACVMDTET